MPTADGKPTKTNDEIEAETHEMAKFLMTHPHSVEAEIMYGIYERLGDIWLWMKERR